MPCFLWYLLVFLVFCNSNLNIFGFPTVGKNKTFEDIKALKHCNGHFNCFLLFYRPNDADHWIMTIIVRCSTTENEMQEIFSYQWCRIQGPPSKVADCMTKNIKEAVQRGTGYSVKCSKCTSCNTSKPLYLNHLNFACVVTSTTASATPNRHLSMLKKKKKAFQTQTQKSMRRCVRVTERKLWSDVGGWWIEGTQEGPRCTAV